MTALKTDLRWGETPWDDLPREELLRVTQRFYSALTAAHSVLRMHSDMSGQSPFWSTRGTGGRALAKTTQALGPYDDGGPYREAIYRRFFRVADDLLFDGLGHGWHVCDVCGCMLATADKSAPDECIDCAHKGSKGRQMRPITWDDMKPRRSE